MIRLCIVFLLWISTSTAVISQCMLDSVIINSILSDPTGNDFSYDTNNDGLVNSDDEYIEICNTSMDQLQDISGWLIGDDDPPPFADYMIPDSTFLEPGECLVLVFDYCGGEPTQDSIECEIPVGILNMDLSGTAILGNSGDVITLSDALGERSCSVTYGDVMCQDVDPLDIPTFNADRCDYWGTALEGCALLADGDSCTYFPAVLSLELLAFEARAIELQKVQLNWQTIYEYNTQDFLIEWRNDNMEAFQIIGDIDAQFISNEITDYRFVHNSPVQGNNYYRLRQEDIDGSYTLSPIRSVLIKLEEEILVIPTIAEQVISINGSRDNYTISIYHLNGQNYVEKQQIFNNEKINISNLTAGHYMISIFDGSSTRHRRFIKL